MTTRASDPTDLLQEVLDKSSGGFVELRYHKKRSRAVAVEKGRIETAQSTEHTGVGVRVLEQGTWGFASTDDVAHAAIAKAIDNARTAARASARARKERCPTPAAAQLARGRFDAPGVEELLARPFEATLDLVLRIEAQARAKDPSEQQRQHCDEGMEYPIFNAQFSIIFCSDTNENWALIVEY